MAEILSHPIVAMVVLLGLLVFVHEFGHFIVGKAFGIGVEIFSIGFGPTILGFEHKGTQYRLSCLPLGGFVKFAGFIPTESVPERFRGSEFCNASVFARTCTIVAGPLANFLLAIAVYAFLGMQGIEHPSPVIGQVRHGSPAESAGLRSGDRVNSIDGKTILSWTDLQEAISAAPDKALDIGFLRDSKEMHLNVVPQPVMLEDVLGKIQKRGQLGIGYGFLPPYISLMRDSTAARKAGVVGGQEIRKAGFGEKEWSITSWDQFIHVLEEAFAVRAESIWIDVRLAPNDAVERKTLVTEGWSKLVKDKNFDPVELPKYLGLTDAQVTVNSVESPSDGVLQKGDRLLSVEGKEISDLYVLYEFLQKNEHDKIHVTLQRGEAELAVELPLRPIEIQKASGKATAYLLPVSFLGALVSPPSYVEIYRDIFSTLQFAVRTTAQQSLILVRVIGGLFRGEVPLKVLGGPILIAKMAGDSAKLGLQSFLTSLALVSINLGVLNLFPIPALDGGKLFMTGMEFVLRRRLRPAFVENYEKVGFILILSLIVLATYNDLSRFWSSMLQGMVGLFK